MATQTKAPGIRQAHHYPEVGVPLFRPFGFAEAIEEAALETTLRNLKYVNEVERTQVLRPRPQWATANSVTLDLHTMELRDFSQARVGTPVLVLAPYAGHTAVIADFHADQTLVATLLANGCKRVFVTDWKSAIPTMRDYDIDNYLEEINVAVDDLGGRVALVGLCQGGWCAAMYAARFPEKVEKLVPAGAPIDTDAGNGAVRETAHALPMRFYQDLVAAGDGLLKGAFMLQGYKNLHPTKQYVEKYVELYDNINDPSYVTCPVYLLAGDTDDITPQEQVFAAEILLGTGESQIQKDVAAGGHIGLFMGKNVLESNWVRIAEWLR